MARQSPSGSAAKRKIKKVFDEAEAGTLHSGGPSGPAVTNRKQIVAIALSEGRRAGKKRKKGY